MDSIQIILEVILILIGLYLALFKSYFQEKGKNIATKQDIEEITEKVETIKNNLMFGTQSKLTLKNEERNALVGCYEKYSYWLNACYDIYFGGIIEQNQTKLEDMDNKLQSANFEFEMAQGKMELFVNNESLTELFNKIKLYTLQLQHLSQGAIVDVEYNFFEIEKMKSQTPPAVQLEPYKELLNKRRERLKTFNEAKIEQYTKVVPLNKELQIVIYNHLQSLLED
jgi:uncharacterized protein YlzI (FlbEa/FlbD family)